MGSTSGLYYVCNESGWYKKLQVLLLNFKTFQIFYLPIVVYVPSLAFNQGERVELSLNGFLFDNQEAIFSEWS